MNSIHNKLHNLYCICGPRRLYNCRNTKHSQHGIKLLALETHGIQEVAQIPGDFEVLGQTFESIQMHVLKAFQHVFWSLQSWKMYKIAKHLNE